MRDENKIKELEEVRGLKITTVAETFKEVFSGEAFEEIKNSDYYKNRQDFLEGKKLAVQNEHGEEIDADKKIYVQENGCEKTRFYDEDGNEICLIVGFAEVEKEEPVRVTFKVTSDEKDILDKLKSAKNMSGYIKNLIRADIKNIKNKKNILLISRGKYGKSVAVIHPESKEELLREIHYIAKGYHCDYDSVTGIVFSGNPDEDNIEEYAYDNAEFKTQNLLFTGWNADDGLEYNPDKDIWIAEDGREYSSAEDYYIEESNEDYSGEIAELFSCYNRK